MNSPTSLPPEGLSRIDRVLEIIPTSRTSWYRGIKEGRYPAPVKIGPNQAAWRNSDIIELAQRLSSSAA
ncbi:helix-turn-helix transcriptional regulator [Marinicaulis aureus]|uniref:Helix-turn-helix transcriptional regulator n=1 Tax=Hyphococcus aureus TaxID=2666033 RepID=A0ABW1L202_9PROT